MFQSSIEGEIVNAINFSDADGIVLNAGSYTHYSIAIRDAVSASGIPTVEVHMSNLFDREDFRNHSVISAAAMPGRHSASARITASTRDSFFMGKPPFLFD